MGSSSKSRKPLKLVLTQHRHIKEGAQMERNPPYVREHYSWRASWRETEVIKNC